MYQLGVINNQAGNKSLFDLINKTSTVLGKRQLYKDLCKPKTCIDTLNDEYTKIEKLMPNIETYEHKLKQIYDVERIVRKLYLENINPIDIVNLYTSYEQALSLMVSENHESTNSLKEVIIATSATIEGQTTAHYIEDSIQDGKIKITKLAQGLPVGGEIEQLDDGTLFSAFKNRVPVTGN